LGCGCPRRRCGGFLAPWSGAGAAAGRADLDPVSYVRRLAGCWRRTLFTVETVGLTRLYVLFVVEVQCRAVRRRRARNDGVRALLSVARPL
jgi:hypothetical protein